jgi:hypothetical protein
MQQQKLSFCCLPSPAYPVSMVVRSCANIFCGLVSVRVFPFLATCTFMPLVNWPANIHQNVTWDKTRLNKRKWKLVTLKLTFKSTLVHLDWWSLKQVRPLATKVGTKLHNPMTLFKDWTISNLWHLLRELMDCNWPEHTRTKATLSRCFGSMFAWSCILQKHTE